MNLSEFIEQLNSGKPVIGSSEAHQYMIQLSQEALKITMQLNNAYHEPEEIRNLMSTLIGKAIPESFSMFPPFYTDCGKNTTFGENVFVNSGCHFQDQGGITIGDNALIGHNAVLATLNHDYKSNNRGTMFPAPIVIQPNVWLGANVTILPGVTIGENAVVSAGAVVTKDVAANTIVGGIPARIIKKIEE